MKINEVIKKKRKELGLTQEEIAKCLNVSTPAVNKWESGVTYPDITLVAPLARLLKVDLNTLLSFKEELSDKEIAAMSEKIAQKCYTDFNLAYDEAMDMISEYPNCNKLIYMLVVMLIGGKSLSNQEIEKDKDKHLYDLLRLLEESNDAEIKIYASHMLAVDALKNKEYKQVEEHLKRLPQQRIDSKPLEITCYTNQKKYDEATEIIQKEIMLLANKIENYIFMGYQIKQELNDLEQAEYYKKLLNDFNDLLGINNLIILTAKISKGMQINDMEAFMSQLEEYFENLEKPVVYNRIIYDHVPLKDGKFDKKMIQSMLLKYASEINEVDLLKEPRFIKLLNKYEENVD